MIKSNNSYKILGIACDEYGKPQISDNEIEKKYVEALIKLFISYNQEIIIIQEEKNKRNELEDADVPEEEISKKIKRYIRSQKIKAKMNISEQRDKQFICSSLGIDYKTLEKSKENKNTIREFVNFLSMQTDLATMIPQIESMVCNHEFLEQYKNYRDIFELYKSAYEKIKDTSKRKKYNNELKEEKDEYEKSKDIRLERKEYNKPDTTFLGIHKNPTADNNYKMLFGDDKRVLLAGNRFVVLTAKNEEQVTNIKSKARLESQELIEYTVLTRKDGKMSSVNFISGSAIEQFFKRKDNNEQKKKEYFRAVVIALKNKIKMHRPMLGEIKIKESSNITEFEEQYNLNLAKKVKEFEEERESKRRNGNRWER